MVGSPTSVHVLKLVVAELGSELAPILSLEMAVRDVQANRRKHATRKPVKVRNFVPQLCFSLCACCVCVSVSVFQKCCNVRTW